MNSGQHSAVARWIKGKAAGWSLSSTQKNLTYSVRLAGAGKVLNTIVFKKDGKMVKHRSSLRWSQPFGTSQQVSTAIVISNKRSPTYLNVGIFQYYWNFPHDLVGKSGEIMRMLRSDLNTSFQTQTFQTGDLFYFFLINKALRQ